MKHVALASLLLAALALGLSLSAGAAHMGHPHGHPSGIVPPNPRTGGELAYGSGDLNYGGGDVMHTVKDYAIYWVPSGYSYNGNDSGYENTLNQFFTDVAAASGTNTNVYAIDTQYSDTTNGNISYNSSFGGSIVDTNAFPADGCTDGMDQSCLTEAQLETEIQRVVEVEHWPQNGTSQYFIFTPQNNGSCFDGSGTTCAYSYFCAYHDWFPTSGGEIIFADQPWTANWQGGACDVGQYPNGIASGADPTINVVSHENNEAITDPDTFSGWIDNAGYEIGDKCAWVFGDLSGSGIAQYNQTINGHHYFLQEEYSNLGHDCFQSMPAVPANTAAPSITGTATVGQTLTGNAGTWSGSPTSYTYTWLHCDSGGANCATISSASSSSASTTYRLRTTDDAHTIELTVAATNGIGAGASITSAPTGVVNGEPVNTAAPTITGTATVGQKLTGHVGSWTFSPSKYAVTWERCDSSGNNCTAISTQSTSSTTSTYKVSSADGHHTLRISVTARNAVGTSAAAISAATGAVPGAPVNSVGPAISGTPTVGQTLSAGAGSWAPTATQFTYVWQRCDTAGANCATIRTNTTSSATNGYVLQWADRGHTIRVKVSAQNPAGSSTSVQSAASAVVR